ncbi:hypothetical protein V2G26_020855 [Clonostachys chloroleuca]
MEAPFEDREKRFVLAEMIKNSSIDADVLAAFVRSSQIEPNWMYMQLPSGRSMHQCMEAASQMSIAAPSLKRKPWEDISFEHQAKRPATSERHEPVHHGMEHVAPPPASLSPHIAILPRPTSANPVHQQQTLSHEGPKKRGRPSRADKAKRDLRPILPQPPPVLPPSSNGAFIGGSLPRPTLPSLLSASPSESRPMTPPKHTYQQRGHRIAPERGWGRLPLRIRSAQAAVLPKQSRLLALVPRSRDLSWNEAWRPF